VLLALDIGAAVTGEGVETHGELDTLATLGVDYAQGYLLGKPTTDTAIWQSWAPATGSPASQVTPARPTDRPQTAHDPAQFSDSDVADRTRVEPGSPMTQLSPARQGQGRTLVGET
jgi:hypothetical protein